MSSVDISESMMKAVFPAFDGLGLALPERRTRPRQGVVAKRRLDLALAGLAIVLLLPLLGLVALAIKLDSKGPIFFTQRRTGLGSRVFGVRKFRSMHVMEDGAEVTQAAQGDVRITRVGRVLRKLSLDELPQLFNVIAGDMSLVGPRPHAVAHDDFFGARISNYAVRFAAKPGITGWAQVNGARGATPTLESMQARIDLDAWYVAHAGLALDLKILAMTPLEVISTRNAL
ncbi:MAG: exopolysaccharide biosynthesis protein [Alphaproteobacteria bacterium]|nr:exopolysaccharide biosynthesis protein [Alphaproteobacteria bacterium]MDB5739783.1 exopolysaccharide biosynthesis protein [Alphaproteobacteria bacterium]